MHSGGQGRDIGERGGEEAETNRGGEQEKAGEDHELVPGQDLLPVACVQQKEAQEEGEKRQKQKEEISAHLALPLRCKLSLLLAGTAGLVLVRTYKLYVLRNALLLTARVQNFQGAQAETNVQIVANLYHLLRLQNVAFKKGCLAGMSIVV